MYVHHLGIDFNYFLKVVCWECGSVVKYLPCIYMIWSSIPTPQKQKKKKSLEFTHFFPIILFFILLFFTIDLRFDLLFNFGGAKNWTQGLVNARQAIYHSVIPAVQYAKKLSFQCWELNPGNSVFLFVQGVLWTKICHPINMGAEGEMALFLTIPGSRPPPH